MGSGLSYAVIPLGGRGSRLLPLTYAIPKWVLPIGPRSALHWTLLEAETAGIDNFILIIDSKSSLKSFLPQPTAERLTSSNQKHVFEEILDEWIRLLKKTILVPVIPTLSDSGFTAAIVSAQEIIGAERFAVLLPDALVFDRKQGIVTVVNAAVKSNQWAVGLTKIQLEQADEFGVVETKMRKDSSLQITYAIEKPGNTIRFEGKGIAGRYVFTPDMFLYIKELQQRHHDSKKVDCHPTFIINHVAGNTGVTGVMLQSPFYHIGIMGGYIAACNYWTATHTNGIID